MADLLVMLDELAEQYVSEKEAQVESNRLTMLLAGDTGSPAEDTRRDNSRKKKSKAPCWAWARGKCSRGMRPAGSLTMVRLDLDGRDQKVTSQQHSVLVCLIVLCLVVSLVVGFRI